MRKAIPLLLALVLLPGCLSDPPPFNAVIEPTRGHVPYEATITVSPVGGPYIYQLPMGQTIESESNTITVTVDWIEWGATVWTMKGGKLLEDTVHATGTNALPRVNAPIINADPYRWCLVPFERTLIDFAGNGNRGVQYDGEWRVESIVVWGNAKPQVYSTFFPPYESGVCRTMWRGLLHEYAGIVYPCYTSVPNAIPYTPTNLDEGYPYYGDYGYRHTNALDWGWSAHYHLEIPPQEGRIRVTIVDEFGREVIEEFIIPIMACDFRPR